METRKLELAFLSGSNRKLTISVDDPKADLEDIQVEEAMNSIIESNIFTLSGSDLMEIENARIVTTSVNNII